MLTLATFSANKENSAIKSDIFISVIYVEAVRLNLRRNVKEHYLCKVDSLDDK